MGLFDIIKGIIKGEHIQPPETADWIYKCLGIVTHEGKVCVKLTTMKGHGDTKIVEYHDEEQILHDLEHRNLTRESKLDYEEHLEKLRRAKGS